MTAGERLQAFRKSRGLTQAALAALLHCNQTYVGLLERGKRGVARGIGMSFALAVQELTRDWRDERGRRLGPITPQEWMSGVTDAPSAREAAR